MYRRNCNICGREYEKDYNCSKKNWEKSKYCSWACKNIGVSVNHVASRHPNWKGGKETRNARRVFYEQQRKIRKRGNGGMHSMDDWEKLKAQYDWTCPMCKRPEPEIKLTKDHIIPLVKGGSNNIENIQPLCQSCNSIKGIKILKL